MEESNPTELHQRVQVQLHKSLICKGYEVAPFLVGWYNDRLTYHAKTKDAEDNMLHYEPNTLAFVVISNYLMFDGSVIPFVQEMRSAESVSNDPIGQCTQHHISRAMEDLGDYRPTAHYASEEEGVPFKAAVLFGTAGHVSGMAYQYTSEGRLEASVCVHPRYGGWFAFRAVVVFAGVQAPQLPRALPMDLLPEKQRETILRTSMDKELFTRDLIPVPPEWKYSCGQICYLRGPNWETRKELLNVLCFVLPGWKS